MDMDAIEGRLCNWARQYKPGNKIEVCGSIEGKLYRSPWRQWCLLHEIPFNTPIDWKDAEIVERAWVGMLGKPKLLLKYTYMTNFPAHVVARKSGVKVWQLEHELARAKRHIAKLLDSQIKICNDGNKFDPPMASIATSQGLFVAPREKIAAYSCRQKKQAHNTYSHGY